MIDAATRRLVRDRASDRCEYCGLSQAHSPLAALQIEHILPHKHGGGDDAENLALACIDCNLSKGSNIAGIDPVTGAMTQLYHPRQQTWSEHFVMQRSFIAGKTAVGRTTVAVMKMNSEEQLQLRLARTTS